MIDAATYCGDITAAAIGRIAVLPTGSTEYHGPHGYLAVDSAIAGHLAERVAEGLDGVLLPRVDYTWCPAPTRGYPGTISVPQDVMQDYFAAILRGVLEWGVRGILALCCHDGNMGPLAVAADRVGATSPQQFIVAVNWWETWSAEESGARFRFSENGGHGHGGPLEMSAAWAVHPTGIDPHAAPEISTAGGASHAPVRVLHRGAPQPRWAGYHGRVGESSPEAGRVLLEEAARRIVATVQSLSLEIRSS
jgi:creatinine amidohydrolase